MLKLQTLNGKCLALDFLFFVKCCHFVVGSTLERVALII
jgi:hypothetical protein